MAGKRKCKKRLPLVNLHEIYVQFKNETNEKIGFSTFCALRPKWCIIVSISHTHLVCICARHQNAKLMSAAVDKRLYYRDLMVICVCDVQNRDCIRHHCDICPSTLVLNTFLIGKLCENYYQDDAIPFRKWQTTDKSNLEEVELDFYDFLDEICDQIRDLTVHDFMSSMSSVIYSRTGINELWILKNSSELLQKMNSFHYPKITSI